MWMASSWDHGELLPVRIDNIDLKILYVGFSNKPASCVYKERISHILMCLYNQRSEWPFFSYTVSHTRTTPVFLSLTWAKARLNCTEFFEWESCNILFFLLLIFVFVYLYSCLESGHCMPQDWNRNHFPMVPSHTVLGSVWMSEPNVWNQSQWSLPE